jgi:hypothetical protein
MIDDDGVFFFSPWEESAWETHARDKICNSDPCFIINTTSSARLHLHHTTSKAKQTQYKQTNQSLAKSLGPVSISSDLSLSSLSLSLSISLSLSRKASPAAHILLFFSFVPRRLFLRRLLLELLVLHGPGDGADHVRLEVLVQLCQYRRPGVAAPYADPLKAKFETSLYLSHFIGSKGWFEKTYRCAFASAMGQVKR